MKTLFDAELGIKSDYKSFFKETTFKTGAQVTRLVIKEYFKKQEVPCNIDVCKYFLKAI